MTKKISLRYFLRTLFWGCSVLIMVLVFVFSSQPGPESSQLSSGFISQILTAVYPDFKTLTPAESQTMIQGLQSLVRKTAHLTVFAGLGCFVSLALLTNYMKQFTRWWVSELICVVYAISDEVHQIFVPNRGPMFTDILIDSAGATIGILVVLFVIGRMFSKHILRTKPVLTDNGD